MTDQITPRDERHDEHSGESLPPPAFTRSDRMKSEIMAGGAVSEHGDDEVGPCLPEESCQPDRAGVHGVLAWPTSLPVHRSG